MSFPPVACVSSISQSRRTSGRCIIAPCLWPKGHWFCNPARLTARPSGPQAFIPTAQTPSEPMESQMKTFWSAVGGPLLLVFEIRSDRASCPRHFGDGADLLLCRVARRSRNRHHVSGSCDAKLGRNFRNGDHEMGRQARVNKFANDCRPCYRRMVFI